VNEGFLFDEGRRAAWPSEEQEKSGGRCSNGERGGHGLAAGLWVDVPKRQWRAGASMFRANGPGRGGRVRRMRRGRARARTMGVSCGVIPAGRWRALGIEMTAGRAVGLGARTGRRRAGFVLGAGDAHPARWAGAGFPRSNLGAPNGRAHPGGNRT